MFDEIRSKIDRIDVEILRLLGERFSLVQQIGEAKKQSGMEVLDNVREDLIKERLFKIFEGQGLSKEFIASLYDLIFEESRRLQG